MKPLVIPVLMFSLWSSAFSMEELKKNTADEATMLASSPIKLEEYIDQNKSKKWVTLEMQVFNYQSSRTLEQSNNEYYFANSFDGKWGEMVVYPKTLTMKSFAPNGILGYSEALSILSYELIPATDMHPAYFIAEKINNNTELKGCSQACIKYFVDEFVAKRTDVEYVFSDLRNVICQHFFPKYGFQLGTIEEFKNVNFTRPMKAPSFWVKK